MAAPTFYYFLYFLSYSGAVYSGGWHGNKKHGRGRFVFQNGQVFEGVFDSDMMVGGAPQEGEGSLLRPQTPLGSLIGESVSLVLFPCPSSALFVVATKRGGGGS